MTLDGKPSWKRLALYGGVCAALVCLYFVAPQIGGHWYPELLGPYATFLVGAIPVGLAAGALAALQVLSLRSHIPAWLCWPLGAILGGAIFGVFALLALESLTLALFTASVWAFAWLFFCWGRPS